MGEARNKTRNAAQQAKGKAKECGRPGDGEPVAAGEGQG